MEKFPDLATLIEMEFMKSESFREICEDYVICLNSIRKMESSDPEKKAEYLQEFREALYELEKEMISFVKKDIKKSINQ